MSITQHHKTCPVCGDDFIYIDIRNVPDTCSKRMCRVNYKVYQNRSTAQGDKLDLKEMGTWGPSKDYKKSKTSATKK